MIEKSDIVMVLSGGADNTLSIDSLGGDPSVTVVPTRLFSTISPTDAEAGFTDYRCIYVANNHDTDSLYNTKIFITDEIADGADVKLGFLFQDDIQQVVINGTVSSGSFSLFYDGNSFTVNYNATLSTWASNFQTAIRAVSDALADVTVTGSTSGSRTIFQVEFVDGAGSRYHPLLELDDNNLSPVVSISIAKITEGSPINSVAPEIDTPKTAPNSITFYYPTENDSLEFGEFRATDMIPVWIKRQCAVNTIALEDDGFSLEIQGNPISD